MNYQRLIYTIYSQIKRYFAIELRVKQLFLHFICFVILHPGMRKNCRLQSYEIHWPGWHKKEICAIVPLDPEQRFHEPWRHDSAVGATTSPSPSPDKAAPRPPTLSHPYPSRLHPGRYRGRMRGRRILRGPGAHRTLCIARGRSQDTAKCNGE